MNKPTILILTLLCILSCTDNIQTENLRAKVDNLKAKNDSLVKVLADGKLESNYWFDARYDGKHFIKNGIENPVEYIEKSLRENPDLIPLQAVLGGTMQFVNVQLLSSEWVIADYEDGHIRGRAIYNYELDPNGQLKFELLSATGPE